MNRYGLLGVGAVFFSFVIAGAVSAQDTRPTGKEDKVMAAASKCPACADTISKITAKREQVRALGDKIRTLRDAKKAATTKTVQAAKTAQTTQTAQKPKLTHEQQLALLQKNDPQMYQLVTQRDTLTQEVRTLHSTLKECARACASKK